MQQFVLVMVLSFCALQVFNSYFGPKKTATTARAMPANALPAAFARLDPAKPPVLDKTAATAEITKLDAQIKANDADDLAYWSRLREGLIQQYVLKDSKAALKLYEELAKHHGSTDVSAQAAYQQGDLLWRQAIAKDGKPSSEAATALESLIHRGRGSSAFLDLQIYVPKNEIAPASAASASIAQTDPLALPAAWELKTVRDLHGSAANPYPNGILERVDQYYATTLYHEIFEAAGKMLGNNPAYSYGLAILVFAALTRLLLQPLNKKQYDSMRGMAVIAPEMKKIQDRYKNKKDQESQMKMMNEIRALQKSHGVNPMMGCGLAAVQLPVFFYVVSPFIQHFEARMELMGASFLWIHNLARPDVPLLGLYALSQFASMRLSATPPADDQQRQMQMMMLFFPFVMPFFLLSWPSAFTMYWMTFNFLSMLFQFRMMKKADPSKNLIDQLIRQPLIPKITEVPANPAAVPGAVPPRPKSASGRATLREEAVKTLAPEGAGANGATANGIASNGSGGDGNGEPAAFSSSNALNGVLDGSGVSGSSNAGATAYRKKRKKR